MKKFAPCLLLLVCALVAVPLFAQSSVQADIPFEFYFGSQLLPAGHYSIEYNQSSRMAMINDSHGRKLMAAAREETLLAPLSASKFSFVERAGVHHLWQFGVDGASSVVQLELSAKMAANDASLKKVELPSDKDRK